MKQSSAFVSVVLILMLLGCGGGTSGSSSSDAPIITGKISDAEGRPVAGAVVSISGADTHTISDSDGQFALEVPESDNPGISVFAIVSSEGFVESATIVNTSDVLPTLVTVSNFSTLHLVQRDIQIEAAFTTPRCRSLLTATNYLFDEAGKERLAQDQEAMGAMIGWFGTESEIKDSLQCSMRITATRNGQAIPGLNIRSACADPTSNSKVGKLDSEGRTVIDFEIGACRTHQITIPAQESFSLPAEIFIESTPR